MITTCTIIETLSLLLSFLEHRSNSFPIQFLHVQIDEVPHNQCVQQIRNKETPDTVALIIRVTGDISFVHQNPPEAHAHHSSAAQQTDKVLEHGVLLLVLQRHKHRRTTWRPRLQLLILFISLRVHILVPVAPWICDKIALWNHRNTVHDQVEPWYDMKLRPLNLNLNLNLSNKEHMSCFDRYSSSGSTISFSVYSRTASRTLLSSSVS